jgi:CMP-N,N'-diacetyllegionaminic acid synthase
MPKTGILGIIPARAGSKGVPNKNISPVGGKPLIAWTIEAALHSAVLDRIVLTTESEAIASIGRNYGAETPFMRPPALSEDTVAGIEPIIHAVGWLGEHESYSPDYVMVLQPTSPLRSAVDIQSAVVELSSKKADGIVSVCLAHQHPYWMKSISESGLLSDFTTGIPPHSRRQDLPQLYALNGAIYVTRRELLMTHRRIDSGEVYAYIMPMERSLDIDWPWDMYLADLVLRDRVRNQNG